MGASGEEDANVRKNAAKNHIGTCVSFPANLVFQSLVRSGFSPKLGLTETETSLRLMPNVSNLDRTQEDRSIPVQLQSIDRS